MALGPSELGRYGHLYPEAGQALRDRFDALHVLSQMRESAALDGPETDRPTRLRLKDSREPASRTS